MRAFVLALQLLTRLPIPSLTTPPQPRELGLSVLFFPGVGLLIGALLAGALLAGMHTALWLIDPGVLAALVLMVWVLLTGGLHLDGLADTADAWIGGQGDRERTMAIMKDPRSGPIAIVVIVLLLLTKFAALQVLLAGDAVLVLLLAPVLGRTVIVLLLITTPYVRPDGLGSPYATYLPRWSCSVLVLLIAVATAALLEGLGGILLAVLTINFIGLRHSLMTRLGGVTGDTLGAVCELTEMVALLVPALLAD
ncbi:MAG TPA: adenosylcobinamide-GDP ribazoletransferase [Candidatus Competibacteraceae bacterium]|nr:adenosylcobinamide-GDP ribazoletransferase [Candidatus Competibacteraceae bacterium]HRZ07299.1 adenosylcobinamide-GDP ribazoletransferase [Candidatus Competibacteraceae bacterium]